MDEHLRSSDIREILETDQLSDTSVEELEQQANRLEDDNFSDFSVGNITDYASDSDDNYTPHHSELDTSDEENVDDSRLPTPVVSPTTSSTTMPISSTSTRPNHTILTSTQQWVRVYAPENEIDVSTTFRVRNSGIKNCPPRNTPPISYFNLFFTQTVFIMLVNATNAYARKIIQEKTNTGTLTPNSMLRKWVPVTVSELKRYIAILINMGLNRKKNIKDYWSTRKSQVNSWFNNTMSRVRFELITSMIHITADDYIPRGQPGYDAWQKVRKLLDSVNHAFKLYFTPFQNICIDESMIGMKNRTVYLQYMPNKRHARFGIKKFEVCDSRTGYVMHTELYSGKYFVSNPNSPFTQQVVMSLLRKSNLLNKNYHLFTDNFYTKLPLAEELILQETYLTGTVNRNTKDLSKTVINTKLNEQESIYFRKGKVLLVGYKQKKKTKPVYLLSTGCHAEDKLITSRRGAQATKPILINQYNLFMGGVDMKDKSLYHYSLSRTTFKYWKKIFYNLLDMCVLNAYVLYKQNTDKPMSRSNFMLEILEELGESDVGNEPSPIHVPGSQHALTHLPGKKQMKMCPVCSKRSVWWCPGCNCGVHPQCFSKMEHFWRPLHSIKRARQAEDSEDNS